jgi:hypothetical protein
MYGFHRAAFVEEGEHTFTPIELHHHLAYISSSRRFKILVFYEFTTPIDVRLERVDYSLVWFICVVYEERLS